MNNEIIIHIFYICEKNIIFATNTNLCPKGYNSPLMKNFLKYFSLITLLVSLLNTNVFAQDDNNTIFLLDSIQKLPDDTSKVIAYNDLIWKIKYTDILNAFQIGEQSIQLAKKLKYKKGLGYANKNIGAVYYYQGDYEKAIELYLKSLEYFNESKFKIGIAKSNHNLGNIYYQRGNWKQALEYYLTTLSIYEEINNEHGKALIYNSIGLVYANNEQLVDSSIAYYKKSLKIFLRLENKYDIATSYFYIGDYYYYCYKEKNDSSAANIAIDYLNRCREISQKNNFLRFEAYTDELLGHIFIKEEKYEQSYEYFVQAIGINEKIGNQFGIANSLRGIAQYYIETNNYKEAKKNIDRSLNIAIKIEATAAARDAYGLLSDLYYATNEYEKALENYRIYIDLKDSLFNKEIDDKITSLIVEQKFEQKQKEQEIIYQSKQKEQEIIHEANIKRQKTITYFFISGFLLMIILALVIFKNYKNKQQANKLLALKNNEITQKNAMLNQQNEEIEAQRDEIEIQRDFVIKQRDKISNQNQQITHSIKYARRIQKAVLTPQKFITKILPDSFILFEPRDIVSGDFYWATKKDDLIIITAADCTGHGVPGAFMSMLGVSFLNEIVNLTELSENIKANEILNKLRKQIITSLRQTEDDNETKDGMDMSLCIIDNKNMKMQFAGAYNSIYLVRNNELTKYIADRMPVGIYHAKIRSKSFTNQIIDIKMNDRFYLSSDGYIDQFGGTQNRKFTTKNFKKMILKYHKKTMLEQKEIFAKILNDWKNHTNQDGNTYQQVDDIIVIGFKITK